MTERQRRRSIFGSAPEGGTFRALRSRWGKQLDVFPQVSVTPVVGFEIIRSLDDEVSREYLLKTEFDYVVCRKNSGVPILVVEFDGLAGGFSRDLRYETRVHPIKDPRRRQKLDAKLSVCGKAGVPAVVVSYQEIQALAGATHLTVLDAIIGQVFAADLFRQAVAQRSFDSVEEAETLEITLDLNRNPVSAQLAKLGSALEAVSPGGGLRSQSPVDDRSHEDMVGCRTVVGYSCGEVGASVYVRDINCEGFTAYGLAEDLSWLAALQGAARAINPALLEESA